MPSASILSLQDVQSDPSMQRTRLRRMSDFLDIFTCVIDDAEYPIFDPSAPFAGIEELNGALSDKIDIIATHDPSVKPDQLKLGTSATLGSIAQAATIFRGHPSDFVTAIADERTFDRVYRPLAHGIGGRSESIRESYGMNIEQINRPPEKHLLHIEYSGDFFSLQEVDLAQLPETGPRCPFTQYIADLAVFAAARLHQNGQFAHMLGMRAEKG